jgi:hypothetical protein
VRTPRFGEGIGGEQKNKEIAATLLYSVGALRI